VNIFIHVENNTKNLLFYFIKRHDLVNSRSSITKRNLDCDIKIQLNIITQCGKMSVWKFSSCKLSRGMIQSTVVQNYNMICNNPRQITLYTKCLVQYLHSLQTKVWKTNSHKVSRSIIHTVRKNAQISKPRIYIIFQLNIVIHYENKYRKLINYKLKGHNSAKKGQHFGIQT
jgi:hypothetical protein